MHTRRIIPTLAYIFNHNRRPFTLQVRTSGPRCASKCSAPIFSQSCRTSLCSGSRDLYSALIAAERRSGPLGMSPYHDHVRLASCPISDFFRQIQTATRVKQRCSHTTTIYVIPSQSLGSSTPEQRNISIGALTSNLSLEICCPKNRNRNQSPTTRT